MHLRYIAIPSTIEHMDLADGTVLESQLRRGILPFCVLALLEREATYGFDVIKHLSSYEGLTTSEGTLYPMLSRLRREGLAETEWRESTSGPPRKYYRITAEGKATLQGFRQQWSVMSRAVDQLIFKEVHPK